MTRLADALAPRIAPVLLANLTSRCPYHDSHIFENGDAPHDPFSAHPAFGNSFDWHSSVHSHWTALQLAERGDVDLANVLTQNLSAANIGAETEYLRLRSAYERPYGWAWALLLASAAQTSAVTAARGCAAELRGMGAVIAEAALRWLDVLPLPVRHGVHSNTAFALGLMHDACGALKFATLKHAIEQRAGAWFGAEREWPAAWERSGNDFLSPGLAEADLMRRVLARKEFAAWWQGFVPAPSLQSPLFSVAHVPNVSDEQVVHLHGLNLSRAATLASISRALTDSPLLESARPLYEASIDRAVTGHYSELHWLPTFAWMAATAIDAAEAPTRYVTPPPY
ncbi:MAG: DUF2891 family protein [Candidatus Cybelea sp.]|jgi:hypothetical protein